MERRFPGEKHIPEYRIWLLMFLLLIAFYVGVFGHFRLKAAKSPYAKYSLALFLPLLPIQYTLFHQFKNSKKTIEIEDNGVYVKSTRSDQPDLYPYNSLTMIQLLSQSDDGEKIILEFETLGLLSINVPHGSSRGLTEFLLSKARYAKFNETDLSGALRRKTIFWALLFIFALIACSYYTIYSAMKIEEKTNQAATHRR